MKYNLIFIAFFVFIASLLGCQTSTKNPETFKTSRDTINFGILNYNDTFKTKEKIYNQSNSSLKIINIESSCGCTSFLIKDSTIQKFDSTEFFIEYIPKNSFDSGKVLKRLTIRSNAKSAFKNLIIIGEIKKLNDSPKK